MFDDDWIISEEIIIGLIIKDIEDIIKDSFKKTHHVSGVTCHIFVDKMVEIVSGRSVINQTYPV